jgi:hypothetical protein
MKKTSYLLILLVISFAFLNSGCNGTGSSSCFKTKEDSIVFARKVDSIYPKQISNTQLKVDSLPRKPLEVSFAVPKSTMEKLAPNARYNMMPISFDDVELFARNYDHDPLLKEPGTNGRPYKGFKIDASAYSLLKRKHGGYEELYLRFGRRPSGEYTIMILPMRGNRLAYRGPRDDSKRTDPDNNYDHVDPCPDRCPTDWQ